MSLIVSTLNRVASLENTLLGLKQLRYPDIEIIVVHGPGADGTKALLEREADRFRIAACPVANLSVSRNIGVGLARKPLVAFIDDDAAPEPDWVDQLVSGFARPDVAAVGGFIRDHHGVEFQHQVIVANRFGDARGGAPAATPHGPDEYLSPTGTNVCVRRDCLVEIGGFDEAFSYFLEETDVNLRLIERGWSIAYAPEAEVHHYFLQNQVRNATRVPRSLRQLALSKAYFCWKHGSLHYPAPAIRDRLSRYRAQLRRQLAWFQLTGRLSGADARRLRQELDDGLAEGARLAARGPAKPSPSAPSQAEPAERAALSRLRRPRVGLVHPPHRGGAPKGDLPLELVRLGHEVTAITPAPGRRTVVAFDGAWRHQVGIGASAIGPSWRRYGLAALSEVERIQPRRQFDVVFCPAELSAALAPLSMRGVKLVVQETQGAAEMDAAVRETVEAR